MPTKTFGMVGRTVKNGHVVNKKTGKKVAPSSTKKKTTKKKTGLSAFGAVKKIQNRKRQNKKALYSN